MALMLKAVVSMWSLASCLGDSIGQDQQVSTALSLVQQRSGSAVAGRAAALAGFQKFADGLVAKYMEARTEPDETTKTAILTVITWIDTFYANFRAEHDVDVGNVAECPGNIEACITDYLDNGNGTHPSNAETIITLDAAKEAARTTHSTCLTTASQCEFEQSQACIAYDNHRSQKPSLPACVGAGKLSDTYIRADVDDTYDSSSDECKDGSGGEQCLPKMEECLEAFKTWVDSLYLFYVPCHRIDDPCAEDCIADQHEFEIVHCEWGEVRKSSCSAYNSCLKNREADCAGVCSDVEIRSNARKADNETGERIKCLLNVLIQNTETKANLTGDDNTKDLADQEAVDKPALLKACVDTVYNTDEWTIECPAGSPDLDTVPVECTPELTEPVVCTADFLSDEYAQLLDVEYCNCRQCLPLEGPKVTVERDGKACPIQLH